MVRRKVKFKNILGKGERASIENISSDFVSLASHQLRTPLSAVKWYTELLLGKGGQLSPKQIEYLKEIYRSNERAINLVNDLLDVSRIQEGNIHVELRLTRVDEVIREVLDTLTTLINSSQVSVNFDILNGPLPRIETDQEKLKRVMVNLISNAIKYSPRKGKITVVVEKLEKSIRISVRDEGIGIKESDIDKVFSKFFRGVNTIKLSPNGTGLGLFIAKSLVEAMGGKINFESKETRGTTFFITLPITNS